MTPRAMTQRARLAPLRCIAVGLVMLAGAFLPRAGSATLGSITTRPQAPTTCDSVGLIVAGTMPSTCYQLIGAVLEGPRMLPTMGPLPTFEFLVRMTVQEPNPLLERPCAVLPPYEHGFVLGSLPAGRYLVRGVEYLVPFSPDSTAAAIDSSKLDTAFDVASATPCPPGKGCALLSFGPSDSSRAIRCDATVKPGFNACFDVVLMNDVPLGGLQTEITVTGPNNNTELPGELFHPVSVVVAPPRTAGFQVAWTAEGSRTKILLFSTTNSAIRAGNGTILHVCYAVAPEVSEGRYTLRYANTTIADPAGGEVPQCLTFAEIVGSICVALTDGCDLNGDGSSDIVDIIQLVRCALAGPGTIDACPDSVRAKADCNNDGVVNIRDVICCVRKILEGGGFGSGGGAPADTSGATTIGFTGPARWTIPTEGRATIEVAPGVGFAGIQFGIDGSGSGARIRELRLLDPTGGVYQLETSVDPGGGSARAMVYPTMYFRSSFAAVPPLRFDVILEPAAGSNGTGTLELVGARSASLSAQAMATKSTAPTATVPQTPGAAPSLSVPAPNPFAVGTEVAYSVPTQRHVTLRVYSVSGRLIRTLVDATVPAGIHRAQWDGRDSAGREARSGIYFFKYTAGEVERTARVMRLR
jgi:FlgD Ig-like domain